MSITIHIRVDAADFQRSMSAFIQAMQSKERILKPVARRGANFLKAYFRELNTKEPNRLGGKRTHFWLQVGRGVQNPKDMGPNAYGVVINHPHYAQKFYGGPIKAKRVKMLTIPVVAEAHGRRAATYELETGHALFFIRLGSGKAGLFEAAESGGIRMVYALTPNVNQKPWKTAFPPKDKLEAEITDQAVTTTKRLLRESGFTIQNN